MANTISARVQFRTGTTFDGRGHKFKQGQTKVLSNKADIAYFQNQPAFKVTILSKAPPVSAKEDPEKPSAPPRAAATPMEGEDDSSSDESGDGDESGTDGDGLLEWRPNMRKAELLAAAESRGMAVTEDDRNADIIQMLREFDEDKAG